MMITSTEEVTVVKIIGVGAQATVSLCKDEKTNCHFAVKKFLKSNWRAAYDREKNALMRLFGLSNVSQLLEFELRTNNSATQSLCLHHYANGDLFELLAELGPLEDKLARSIFKMCLNGIHASHSKHIIHGDIKPENIFFDSRYVAHVGDFALCEFKDIPTPCSSAMTSSASSSSSSPLQHVDFQCELTLGTQDYMCPEVILGQECDGRKADVWSLGCLLFVMLFGNHPFGEHGAHQRDYYFSKYMNDRNTFWKIHEGGGVVASMETKKFIEKILTVASWDRCLVSDLLLEPLLQPQQIYGEHELYDIIMALKRNINNVNGNGTGGNSGSMEIDDGGITVDMTLHHSPPQSISLKTPRTSSM